jgi:hypothetical protein
MARKRAPGRKEPKLADRKALSRRNFFTTGAGAGAAVLSVPSKAQKSSFGARDIRWDYEADVVVLGSGCVGLHAAVRARDLGASGGMMSVTGDPSGPPQQAKVYTGDYLTALTGWAATMMALWQVKKTGQGQVIDLAQYEAVA